MYVVSEDFELNRHGINENEEIQKLNKLLSEIRDFIYKFGFLTYGRDMIIMPQIGAVSGNQILDSASRTVESIRYCCCSNGNFADAYCLLRKFRDDIFYYIYILAVGDKADITKFADLEHLTKNEKNVYSWFKNKQRNVYIGDVFKTIAALSSTKDTIKKYNLQKSFSELAVKLNNYIHSNGYLYYNFSYQRMDADNIIQKYCEEFGEAITYITMTFLLLLSLIRPGLIMAEDYVDYLDCGDNPPENSQFWVAPFVSKFVSSHKKTLDEKCDEYLRSITGMQI